MVSVVINAWKEAEQIKKALNSLLNPEYNDYNEPFEVVIVCPDESTWESAKEVAKKFDFKNIWRVKDPQKGKPYALKMALTKVKSEILVLTDGDVYFGKNVLSKLVDKFKDKKVGGVTGRPVSRGQKDSFMQFANHFYADVAHHKRMATMKKGKFFVLSGYMLAMRNLNIQPPRDSLVEDAYFSYMIYKKGYKLEYAPEAKVYVKYAQHLRDWYQQKLRSVGGYVQLNKRGISEGVKRERGFLKELQYALWYPITYVKNLKEVVWALGLYPMRFLLWIKIFYNYVLKRSKEEAWEKKWPRIESTK